MKMFPVIFPLLACMTTVGLLYSILWIPKLGGHTLEGWRDWGFWLFPALLIDTISDWLGISLRIIPRLPQ